MDLKNARAGARSGPSVTTVLRGRFIKETPIRKDERSMINDERQIEYSAAKYRINPPWPIILEHARQRRSRYSPGGHRSRRHAPQRFQAGQRPDRQGDFRASGQRGKGRNRLSAAAAECAAYLCATGAGHLADQLQRSTDLG